MADVTAVIDRHAADIDSHLGRIQGQKGFFLFGLRIKNAKAHISRNPFEKSRLEAEG
jgi:hypothetical protein